MMAHRLTPTERAMKLFFEWLYDDAPQGEWKPESLTQFASNFGPEWPTRPGLSVTEQSELETVMYYWANGALGTIITRGTMKLLWRQLYRGDSVEDLIAEGWGRDKDDPAAYVNNRYWTAIGKLQKLFGWGDPPKEKE